MTHDIYSPDYAAAYLKSHEGADKAEYRKQYWNHFFIDALINPAEGSHLLEEGGGTCGVWKSLGFARYTSVDVSAEMTEAARALHANDAHKDFVLGDIFSADLKIGTYSAIIANAYGIYYRPEARHLERLYGLLKPGGIAFVAIDPVQTLKHVLVAPVSRLINQHIRTYTRVYASAFYRLAEKTGFRVWVNADYTPAPGWKRRAFFLIKD